MDVFLGVLAVVLLGLIVLLAASVRVVTQYERGVVLRFGRLRGNLRSPGLTMIAPVADRLHKVNMQVVTMPVPAQEGITRDNVTVKVDAVVYYKVFDPIRVVVDVQNYQAAIAQVAQASLRSIIGKSDLDDLLSNRERLNQGLELMLDSPAVDWGVHIDRVDIKDVALPESMKRSMSRQAEAERERRSRVITAEGELQASEKMAAAAEVMATHPAALQLRLLQTVVEVALADDRPQRRLGDLGDGGLVVLHVDDHPDRIEDPEVHDGVDPHGDVVPGDALLGRHRHGHDLHVHLVEPIGHRVDQRQAGGARITTQPAEAEDDAPLELGDHADTRTEEHQQPQGHDREHYENGDHLGLRRASTGGSDHRRPRAAVSGRPGATPPA